MSGDHYYNEDQLASMGGPEVYDPYVEVAQLRAEVARWKEVAEKAIRLGGALTAEVERMRAVVEAARQVDAIYREQLPNGTPRMSVSLDYPQAYSHPIAALRIALAAFDAEKNPER